MALVMLLGLWLIARHLFGWGHSHAHAHAEPADMHALAHSHLHGDARRDAHGRAAGDPHYGHDHGDGEHHHADDDAHPDHGENHVHVVTADQVRGDWREQLGVVVSVGLRPCSGALVVLVFALSQGLLAAGIAAVFLMGLGTAITVGVLATLAVSAKGLARQMLGTDGTIASGLVWWAELLGALCVFGFGLLLLLASFN